MGKKLIYHWVPAWPWLCPKCGTVTVTKESSPRCRRCGFREEAT